MRPAPAPTTQFVRILLESTLPGDDALAAAPKTLSIGGEIRRFSGVTMTLPYAEVLDRPLMVRARDYDVFSPSRPGSSAPLPGAIAPADAPDGIATLLFRATPHPAQIRFPNLDDQTEVWDLATGRPRPDYNAATRTLTRWPPCTPGTIQLRRRGMRPQPVEIGSIPPGTTASCDVALLGLPVYGKPGDRLVIDLGSGQDLVLTWIAGGPVSEPAPPATSPAPGRSAAPATVRTLPRGFWLSEAPVTWAQWSALAGVPTTQPGHLPVEIARPRFAEFAAALQSSTPRLTVRLPYRLELLRAAQTGLRGIAPDAALTLPSAADPRPARPAGVFHIVLSMGLPPLPQ